MSIKIYIIFFALVFCLPSFGQTEKDYRKFKETLNEETKDTGQYSNQSSRTILHPVELPDWIFELPISEPNTIYSIGISEPGMDMEQAIEQAKFRAKVIAAAFKESKVTFIIDNYSNEKAFTNADEFSTRYENLFSIKASTVSNETNFELLNQHFTSFNEAIVLLKYNIDKTHSTDSLILGINSYEAERQKYNKFELVDKFEMNAFEHDNSMPDTINKLFYSFQSLNNLFEIKSVDNGVEYQFPYLNFRYLGQNDSIKTQFESNISTKLNYGLWKAYIETLVQNIFMLSQVYSVKVSQVGDDYTTQNQSFIREVSEANLSFRINSIQVFNNRLSIEMDYLNNPNK